MPVEMRMWRIDGEDPKPLATSLLPAEKDLHEFLRRDPSLLGERLLVIGSEVITPYGPRLDLLAIDADGDLHLLELKRDKTPRQVVAQVLDYGSWVSTLSRDDVIDIAVSAVISDLRVNPPVIRTASDSVQANDQAYSKVMPYAATPHSGRNHSHDG